MADPVPVCSAPGARLNVSMKLVKDFGGVLGADDWYMDSVWLTLSRVPASSTNDQASWAPGRVCRRWSGCLPTAGSVAWAARLHAPGPSTAATRLHCCRLRLTHRCCRLLPRRW